MDFFNYHNNTLHAEEVPIPDIVQKFGTPCYIYSRATFERHWRVFDDAFAGYPHLICYAVKACSNIGILNLLAKLGSGFDVVSGGELARVLQAEGDPQKIVFSGVGKTIQEMEQALKANIFCFNIESFPELIRLNEVAARLNKKAPIAIRINPDIDVKTHPYIATGLKENKFGIAYEEALHAYQEAAKLSHLKIIGLACHIGSQILEIDPFLTATERMLVLAEKLKTLGFNITHFDVGGGLGVRYQDEVPPEPKELALALSKKMAGHSLKMIVEPGRVIAANAGILVTKVEYLKLTAHKNFAVVDAGMNDLMRPALYQAWHNILPVQLNQKNESHVYDIVGPVCESADCLAAGRILEIAQGDLLAIKGAGAYGFSMSSHYNSRPLLPEILIDKNQMHLIREREDYSDLVRKEHKIKEAINMPISFIKMQGLGNDFILIDATKNKISLTSTIIRQLADRHFGIGCDQVLLLEASEVKEADFVYRIFNADGSEVEQCGNGARCVGRYIYDRGLSQKEEIILNTLKGKISLRQSANGNIIVDMGVPQIIHSTFSLEVEGENLKLGFVSLGNPHAVLETTDVQIAPVQTQGAKIEKHTYFPQGVNVGYMEIISPDEINLRVFERGVGETMACGSGACAAVVVGRLRKKLNQKVKVNLKHGALFIQWTGENYPVFMEGPAVEVFSGNFSV